MIYNNILEAVGHTPIIRLNHMTDHNMAEILVKFEGLNVGGSIKTRTALNMIEDAEKKGLINKDTVIVEPTSGNQGIGLALIGAVLLVAMYASTLIFALTDRSGTMNLLMASIACTIILPVLLYAYTLVYKISHKDDDDQT